MWEKGKLYQGFLVTKRRVIKELSCELIELVHENTGAEIMHIAANDPENLFCLSFRTLPTSSNGVAHILEHTVLSGSHKFPVKDPFFAMTRRSLNTFMNALTGQDFTCYPASTEIEKDFYNLLDVYIDAVFCPLLTKWSFMQEGHRLEFSSKKDAKTPLVHKGIVFNEMKGALSSPYTRLSEAVYSALFPTLVYGLNSGGDPREIPSLTHEDLIAFHKRYYHPSHCLFFFYGNLPLEKHLNFLNEHVFKNAKAAPPLPLLPKERRIKEPLTLTLPYPIAEEDQIEDKTLLAIGWLTCPLKNQKDVLALSILEIALMGNDASPLKMALMKSGLTKQVSSFLDLDLSEVPFVITLNGCKKEEAEAIEKLILDTLKTIVKEGIPKELLEGALHQLEFYRSEITGDQSPYGLSLFMRSALAKQHGVNPETGLMIHSLFQNIREMEKKDRSYFTSLIQTYLIDNPHRVRVLLTPDPELALKEAEVEKRALEELQKRLSENDKKTIIADTLKLEQVQKQLEKSDFNILPTVTLKDVPKEVKHYPLEKKTIKNNHLYYHEVFTNHIAYLDLNFKLPLITKEEVPLLRLLTVILPQLGTKNKPYGEILRRIEESTGGISSFLCLNVQAKNQREYEPSIVLKGKALERNTEKLCHLLSSLATEINFFDTVRLKEVIRKHHSVLAHSVQNNALRYATNLSASHIDPASALSNAWYGFGYLEWISQLEKNLDEKLPTLQEALKVLYQKVFRAHATDIIVSADADIYRRLLSEDFYGLLDLRKEHHPHWVDPLEPKSILPQGRNIASPVAFTSKVLDTVPYSHPLAPALYLTSSLFDHLVLHPKIREQGGAYGGGASFNPTSGIFSFYAYRDPHIASSLKAFETAISYIAAGKFTKSDLEEAKFDYIQSQDAPLSPGSRAEKGYAWEKEGKTKKMRQHFRDELLSCTKQEIIESVKTIIVPAFEKGIAVVLAGNELFEKENDKLLKAGKDPLPVFPIRSH